MKVLIVGGGGREHALAWAASQAGLMGFVPDGESFDLGNAEAYRNAVANFGEQNH